jgi:hypothetical protein
MTAGILLGVVALAASVVYGGQKPAPGVVGVDVVVKQIPSRRDVTNAWGIFAFEPLPAGSYTLSFKARPAHESSGSTSDKVIVATVYSITVEGTKRPMKRTGLTSDQLVAGVEIAVEVGAGAKIRGEVRPAANKKMVWIPKETGSNVPGRWVEEGSVEAKAAVHHNTQQLSAEELQRQP